MKELLLATLSLLLSLHLVNGYTPGVYYFDRECTPGSASTIRIQNDLRLKLTRSSFLNRNMNCGLRIETSTPGDNLAIHFRDFSTTYSIGCSKNQLRITNEDGSSMTAAVCGHVTPLNWYVTKGAGAVVHFMTDNSLQSGSFDILFTSFVKSFNGTCPGSRFKCKHSDRCVPSVLKCNGYNDCGGNSDEVEGCGLTVGVIAGVIVGGVVFLVIVSILGFVGRRRYYYRRFGERAQPYPVTQTTTYPPPEAFPGPPQAAYPQPSYQSYGAK